MIGSTAGQIDASVRMRVVAGEVMAMRRSSWLAAIVSGAGLVLPAGPVLGQPPEGPGRAGAWASRPARFAVVVEPDVRITMSDGVRLTADVLRPADAMGAPVPERFPVVLTQTPYNKKPSQAQPPGRSGAVSYRSDPLVRHGYVQVVAEVRGTGSSEGILDPFSRREQKDGAELVAWAASPDRPWSNGHVALFGSSYAAINQFFVAAQRPPELRAIFPISAFADLYRDLVAVGGHVDTTFTPQWFGLVTAFGLAPPTYAARDPGGAAAVLGSHARGSLGTAGTVMEIGGGGERAFDGPYYRERSPIEVIDRVSVPAFLVGGWRDLFPRGIPLLYEGLAAAGTPARMVIGPWDHWDMVGDLPGGRSLRVDGRTLDEWALRWFDRHVLDMPDPALDAMAPVTLCEAAATTCQSTVVWPPPEVSYQRHFLARPGGPLAGGALDRQPAASQGPDVVVAHHGSGVCSRSWTQSGWSGLSGVDGPCDRDQRANDLTGLVFDMPLGRDVLVAGPVSVRLFVETNGRDAFLAVRLEDVAPDGSVTQLTQGALLLSLRALDLARSTIVDGVVVRPYHPFTRASLRPVTAGEIYDVWFELPDTAARLAAGHTLRLAIQPSDWPHLSPTLPDALDSAGAVVRLHHDVAHPSVLVVPLG